VAPLGVAALERPTAPAGSWTMPAPTPPPPASPGARSAPWPVGAKVGVAAFVAVVSAVAAFMAVGRMHHSRISIPDSIAGTQRIVTSASRQAEEQLLDGARKYGVTGKAGFYGGGDLASFAVVAFDYHVGPGETGDTMMRGLASGMAAAGTGSSVDLSTMTTDSAGRVVYRCVRVLGEVPGAICMWEETDVVGVVLVLDKGIPEARLLTETVRLAVEA
jgi:hypothetical protein